MALARGGAAAARAAAVALAGRCGGALALVPRVRGFADEAPAAPLSATRARTKELNKRFDSHDPPALKELEDLLRGAAKGGAEPDGADCVAVLGLALRYQQHRASGHGVFSLGTETTWLLVEMLGRAGEPKAIGRIFKEPYLHGITPTTGCVNHALEVLSSLGAHRAALTAYHRTKALREARPDAHTFAAVAAALRGEGFGELVAGLREEFEANGVDLGAEPTEQEAPVGAAESDDSGVEGAGADGAEVSDEATQK